MFVNCRCTPSVWAFLGACSTGMPVSTFTYSQYCCLPSGCLETFTFLKKGSQVPNALIKYLLILKNVTDVLTELKCRHSDACQPPTAVSGLWGNYPRLSICRQTQLIPHCWIKLPLNIEVCCTEKPASHCSTLACRFWGFNCFLLVASFKYGILFFFDPFSYICPCPRTSSEQQHVYITLKYLVSLGRLLQSRDQKNRYHPGKKH